MLVDLEFLGPVAAVFPLEFSVEQPASVLDRSVTSGAYSHGVLDWYRAAILDTGRSAAVWALLGFVVTFGLTRWITVTIRARKARQDADESSGGPIKDIHIGGVHVHHQVWGILLVLLTGLLQFRFSPGPPWVEVLATLFGVGAALALDEFALWLHLEDVYWSEEGRKSIDAVLVAVVVGWRC